MIPKKIKPFLWSYNTKKMSVKKDKNRIITNILNLGDIKAVKWLFGKYSKLDIKKNVKKPMPGEWNKKSMNYWSLIFGVKPKITGRNIK